jgi:hypothetical protein
MSQVSRPFGGDVLLLEPEAGAIEQRFDCALRHLQRARNLAVAEVLELAERKHETVLLG